MNRRGLFSSGLAARRQDDFTNNYFSALSNAANSMALNLEQDRVAQETARQKQALEFATETYKQLLTNAYGAGPAVQMYTPPATQPQPATNNSAAVFKNIFDQARTLPGRPVVDPGYYVNKQQVYGPLLGNSATASGATAASQSALLNGIKKANPRRLLFGGGRSGSTTLV